MCVQCSCNVSLDLQWGCYRIINYTVTYIFILLLRYNNTAYKVTPLVQSLVLLLLLLLPLHLLLLHHHLLLLLMKIYLSLPPSYHHPALLLVLPPPLVYGYDSERNDCTQAQPLVPASS